MQRPLGVAVLLALGACHAAQPAPPRPARIVLHVPHAPQRALTELKLDAVAHGWRVVDEGLDSLVIDFGVATARVPVATDDGPAAMRDTEVHATALYRFDAAAGGAAVTMWNNPIYWHPELRVWLAAPDDLAPGDALLADCFGPRDLAAAASADVKTRRATPR